MGVNKLTCGALRLLCGLRPGGAQTSFAGGVKGWIFFGSWF